MNLLVFGATGPTGSLVVERALEEGHTVTGFTRHAASLEGRHQRLRPHAGDLLDPDAVLRAVEGHDAVISAFGVPYDPFHAIEVYSKGTRNIVQAMQEHAVQRYVGVTSGGTSTAPQPGSGAFFEWIIKPVFGRTTYADQRRHEQIVMRSPLRWTIARPSRLVNAAATGRYRVEPGYVVPGEHATVRADLADFLVKALADPHWEHQAVAIGSPGAQRAGASNPMRLRPPESPSQPDSGSPGASRSGEDADERLARRPVKFLRFQMAQAHVLGLTSGAQAPSRSRKSSSTFSAGVLHWTPRT